MLSHLPLLDATTRQLKWANTLIAYTDGSAKHGIAGAGVAWSGHPPRTAQIYVGPGSSLKAELCAITHVARISDRAEELYIATDCLTAMSAIQNGLQNSLYMRGHTEEASLRDAVGALHARTRRTTFLKVKAHVGITLNEAADKEAKAARSLPAPAAAPSAPGKPAICVVTADGKKASKQLIAKAYETVCADAIRNAEAARKAKAAASAAAGGAGPSSPSADGGQSIASKWQEAVEVHDHVAPTDYGFLISKLHPSLAQPLARGRMMQRVKRAPCPLPGCGLMLNNCFHGRGPCRNPAQSSVITSAANKSVHTIAKYVAEGSLARWTLLVNAGVAFAANGAEDNTIPDWMLPGTFGNRGYPDKVDLALIIGWGKGSPPPTTQAQKNRIKIVLVEVSNAHDHHLRRRVNEKRTKYVALAEALRVAGWNVALCESAGAPSTWFTPAADDDVPELEEGQLVGAIHTVVIGHCGSHVRTNMEAFAALGIDAGTSKDLMLDLSKLAVRQLKNCQTAYARACKLASPGASPAALTASQSAGPATAAAVAAHAVGIG